MEVDDSQVPDAHSVLDMAFTQECLSHQYSKGIGLRGTEGPESEVRAATAKPPE